MNKLIKATLALAMLATPVLADAPPTKPTAPAKDSASGQATGKAPASKTAPTTPAKTTAAPKTGTSAPATK